MNIIPGRLKDLRALMRARKLDAYLVPSADEHLNEYLPPRRIRREFVSGFNGSAGDLLVADKEAWLFVDGRYHLQADEQLAGTTITPVKIGAPGVKPFLLHVEELARQRRGLRLGLDPMVVPLATGEKLEQALKRGGGQLIDLDGNLVDQIWRKAPPPSTSRLIPLPLSWTGKNVVEKLAQLRQDIQAAGAQAMVVIKLDQIAWLLNLRSRDDVPYNPVFESFLIVDQKALHLFLEGGEKRWPETGAKRPRELSIHEYTGFPQALANLRGSVLIDPKATTRGVARALAQGGCQLVAALSSIETRKAEKNPVEQAAQRRANLKASVAKVRAVLWLREQLRCGQTVSEQDFCRILERLYGEQEGYFGLSFNTIAAAGAHAAVIHYGDSDATSLQPGDLFLIDSGAHIDGGTTDDTRTLAVGQPQAEARHFYTLVLKAHVAGARQRFPEGTSGSALDSLVRSPMWSLGHNYNHGTGHGVGCFLNVHEGPFAISERERREASSRGLKPGMVTSIEPGYYRAGWGGIRLENLYLVEVDEGCPAATPYLRLDPLTFIPFERALMEPLLLSPEERVWINNYQQQCVEKLDPYLNSSERGSLQEWLGEAL